MDLQGHKNEVRRIIEAAGHSYPICRPTRHALIPPGDRIDQPSISFSQTNA
jgi:hypothetical protein